MRKKHSDHIRQKVKDVYGDIAGEFDQSRRAPWLEFEHFLTYIQKEDRVLDLGCGNGRLFSELKDFEVDYLGVDNGHKFIEIARKNHPLAKFSEMDMLKLNLENEAFDAIFSIAAFHHIPSKKLRKKAVSEMSRVLRQNGVLVLTVWNLFQWKYAKEVFKALGSFMIHLGSKFAWNDLWVKWRTTQNRRYYHAFLPHELRLYFPKSQWEVEEFYFVRKGNRVPFWRSFNICLIARKIK